MSVIVSKLEYAGELREGSAKLVKQLETVQMTATEKTRGMPKHDEQYSVKDRIENVPT